MFERPFTRLGSFTGREAEFRSWVFTIAHHRLTDERRRLARRPAPQGDVPEQAAGDVEHDAMARLATERIRRMCERLAPDQRDALLLRLVAGLTIEETALTLGKSATAVKGVPTTTVGVNLNAVPATAACRVSILRGNTAVRGSTSSYTVT